MPKRIPPAKPKGAMASAESSPHTVLAPSSIRLPINIEPNTLAADTYQLQVQLDHLVDQFDQLRQQLRHSQKLASIGTTAAMIAHEFNNLFTPVVAYAGHALESDDPDLMRKALRKTIEQVEVMHAMADRVVGLAKQSNDSIKPVPLLEFAESAIACLCRDPKKDNIGINLQIDSDLKVRANENQLMQVLFNLVINARQAMLGRHGRLTIDAAPHPDDPECVRINVRDTGHGIPPEDLERIFEPFFSTKTSATKPDQKGLGLGLSICRDIIEELNGTIEAHSRLNVGTTFTITLPAAR
jgi:signal transduction histidine kinase